jgi:glycosyltransferase involved in cell wall biosynthesis
MAYVVHVCPRYAPARGGVELFFSKVSEDLARRGHRVSVWTTDAATVGAFTSQSGQPLRPVRETIRGVEVQRFPVRYLPAHKYVRTAAHLLPFGTRWKCDTLRWTPWVPALTRAAGHRLQQVDLVHVAGLPYSSVLLAGVRLAKRVSAPLVISPFTHVPPPGSLDRSIRRAYLSPLNVGLMARADRLFVQTGYEGCVLKDAGLSTIRQSVVGLGVDAADCTGGDRLRFRRAHALSDSDVVVGHLANKSWDKGTLDLLDAMESLWDRGARIALGLAGSEMRSFSERWPRVRHRERIVNLGVISDLERRDFFAAIDVFALPSYVESFGVSPLEAGLNRVPVVAYAHGGPAQLFRDDVNALLVPVGQIPKLADATWRLTSDPSARQHLGAEGQRLAQQYSWTRVFDIVAAEYEALLRRREGQRSESEHR